MEMTMARTKVKTDTQAATIEDLQNTLAEFDALALASDAKQRVLTQESNDLLQDQSMSPRERVEKMHGVDIKMAQERDQRTHLDSMRAQTQQALEAAKVSAREEESKRERQAVKRLAAERIDLASEVDEAFSAALAAMNRMRNISEALEASYQHVIRTIHPDKLRQDDVFCVTNHHARGNSDDVAAALMRYVKAFAVVLGNAQFKNWIRFDENLGKDGISFEQSATQAAMLITARLPKEKGQPHESFLS